MVWTRIIEIETKENNLKIIRFNYLGTPRFTYLTQEAQNYWAEHKGINFNKGDEINVILTVVKDDIRYKIIGKRI